MSLDPCDVYLLLGKRQPTTRETWRALYRVMRVCQKQDLTGELYESMWIVLAHIGPVWWNVVTRHLKQRSDLPLMLSPYTEPGRRMRREYWKRLNALQPHYV